MSDGSLRPVFPLRPLPSARAERRRRMPVPAELGPVTTEAAEEAPAGAAGLAIDAKDRIWAAVEAMYRTGLHPAISICIRRAGTVVLHRSIGHARVSGLEDLTLEPRLATPGTPICLFSASKSISAMLLHKLVEQGKLDLDDPIAEYIPEYGCNGKGHTTVRQLLAHRAGIPSLPRDIDPSLLNDFPAVVALLCATKAAAGAGQQQSYHAVTAGYIVGELVQRISGRELSNVLRTEIAEPLGCRYMSYGLAPGQRHDMAWSYTTGRKPPFPFNWIARRALGVDFGTVADFANHEAFLSSVIPAANIFATADDACRFYQMLLNGGSWKGKQIFKPETVMQAIRPTGRLTLDRTLFVPVRFSPAFVLGEWPGGLFGPRCARAFGHLGFVNVLTWADPDRDLSVALLNTGKCAEPASLATLMRVLLRIGKHCPRLRQCLWPAMS